jgi:hypothetical protein
VKSPLDHRSEDATVKKEPEEPSDETPNVIEDEQVLVKAEEGDIIHADVDVREDDAEVEATGIEEVM